ncbi:MAG TPA: HAD family hydrolase, partial [Burkholderiaceae bacterium]
MSPASAGLRSPRALGGGGAGRGLDWSAIDLVVFDVDGTLYDQARLRRAMLAQLARASLRSRSLDVVNALRHFRRVREWLADQPGDDFATRQYALAAARCGLTAGEVEALAREWMERRPLPLLAACRYPHLDRLFEGLRRAGKRVAVFSDFPAADKLRALGLAAGTVVCSADPDVRRLKPDPAGLHAIL